MPSATLSPRKTNSASSSTDYSARATRYARDVAAGKIPNSKWVSFACERHLRDLDRAKAGAWRYKFDPEKADRFCRFVEVLPHQKGKLQGQKVRLEDWQCFVFCSLFGWVDKQTGFRRFREAFLLIPRGNGKSPMAAWMGLWMAFFDGEKGSEVYCGASNKDQAFEVFKVARAILQMVSELTRRAGITVNVESLVCERQQSVFKPVIGRPKDGASIYLAIKDELHQQKTAEQAECFDTGCSKREGSLQATISTAGSTLEGPCYSEQLEAQKVLEGTIEDDSLFAVIYMADAVEGDENFWTRPEALEMANPNFRVSMDTERLLRKQEEAARNPSKQNAFRQKHLNQWTNAATTWMNMAAWHRCADPSLRIEDFCGADDVTAVHASDLASKLDLCAAGPIFRRDIDGKPHYYCFMRCYIPETQVQLPENRHYQRWVAEEHLKATDGSSIDYAVIEADATEDIMAYPVKEIAYDARYADQYSQRVSEATGVERVVVAPSPAELSPAMKDLEAAVADGRFHHDGHPVLTWAMSNVLTKETSLGNYTMPYKQSPERKIDPAIAVMIGIARLRLLDVGPVYTDPEALFFV